MKRLVGKAVAAVVLMTCLSPMPLYAQNAVRPIVWGYIDFPPRMAAGRDNHPNGELAGVVKGILATLNKPYDPLVLPTRRMLLEIKKNSIDLGMLTPSQVANPDDYLFSESVFGCVELYAYWIPEVAPAIKQLSDLDNQRLVLINGFQYASVRDKVEPKGVVGVEGHSRALQALKLKRADYLLGFERAINALLEDEPALSIEKLKIMQYPIFLVLNRSYPDAENLINRIDKVHLDKFPQHYQRYAACGEKGL